MEIAIDAVAFRKVAQPPHRTVFVEVTVDGNTAATDPGRVEVVPTVGFTFALRQRLSLPGPREQPDRPITLTTRLRCAVSRATLAEVDVTVSKQWTVIPPPAVGEVYVSFYCSFGDMAPPRPLRPASAIAARRGTLSRLPTTGMGASGISSRPTSASTLPPQPLRVASADASRRRQTATAADFAPSRSAVPEMADGRRVDLTITRAEGLSLESKQPLPLRVAVTFARRVRRTPTVTSNPTGLVHAVDFSAHCVSFFVPSFNLTPHVQVAIEVDAALTADGVRRGDVSGVFTAALSADVIATIRLPLHAGEGMQPIVGHPGSLLRYTMTIRPSWEEADQDGNDGAGANTQLNASRSVAAFVEGSGPDALVPIDQLLPPALRALNSVAPSSSTGPSMRNTPYHGLTSKQDESPSTTMLFPGPPVFINGVNITALLSTCIRQSVDEAAGRIEQSLASLERRVSNLEGGSFIAAAAAAASPSPSNVQHHHQQQYQVHNMPSTPTSSPLRKHLVSKQRWPPFEQLDAEGRGYATSSAVRRVCRSCDPFCADLSDAELDREIIAAAVPAEALQRDLISQGDYHSLIVRLTKR